MRASLEYVTPGEENSSTVTSINGIVLYSKHEWQKSSQSKEACNFRFFCCNSQSWFKLDIKLWLPHKIPSL